MNQLGQELQLEGFTNFLLFGSFLCNGGTRDKRRRPHGVMSPQPCALTLDQSHNPSTPDGQGRRFRAVGGCAGIDVLVASWSERRLHALGSSSAQCPCAA
jgi:hypothetical protein